MTPMKEQFSEFWAEVYASDPELAKVATKEQFVANPFKYLSVRPEELRSEQDCLSLLPRQIAVANRIARQQKAEEERARRLAQRPKPFRAPMSAQIH